MKKCDYFKDIILTDYIDGELDKSVLLSLESHLLDCSDCRAFVKEVKDNAALPFKKIENMPVPSELWGMIRQRIEDESPAPSPSAYFMDKLRGLFVFPRILPVFASLVLMVLAGSVTLNTMQIRQAQSKDQGEYLIALLGPTDASTQTDNEPGTPIEHYFL